MFVVLVLNMTVNMEAIGLALCIPYGQGCCIWKQIDVKMIQEHLLTTIMVLSAVSVMLLSKRISLYIKQYQGLCGGIFSSTCIALVLA